MRSWAADLLHFWFHDLGPRDWFAPSEHVDRELDRRFGHWLVPLSNQPPQAFLTCPGEARAAILLLDQIPRNLFRGERSAFAWDRKAVAICRGVLCKGWDKGLSVPERQFTYMPMMHSEDIADQQLSLRLFTELGNPTIMQFARDHYRMIARFGRYPHRNAVLGRRTTAAEQRAIDGGNAW